MTNTTHFGYKTVSEDEKFHEVAKVFHSVASKYDVMNDLMSGGLHRLWKTFTIAKAGVRPGFKVLDIACGTGDLSKAFAKQAGPSGEVWLTDINESTLRVGRDRLLNNGLVTPTLLCDAEKLPFADNYFERVSVAFGLRNMTHKDQALAEKIACARHCLRRWRRVLAAVRVPAGVLAVGRSARPRPGPGSAAIEQARRWHYHLGASRQLRVQPTFSDGHNTGLYSFEYLYKLGREEGTLWADYMARLHAAGFDGETGRAPGAAIAGAPTSAGACGHKH
jgi:ubiquinone/menaquinone biosynthesis C-methylase UbiE